jgi:hypothetical protein
MRLRFVQGSKFEVQQFKVSFAPAFPLASAARLPMLGAWKNLTSSANSSACKWR